jgi:hypothetical protein
MGYELAQVKFIALQAIGGRFSHGFLLCGAELQRMTFE